MALFQSHPPASRTKQLRISLLRQVSSKRLCSNILTLLLLDLFPRTKSETSKNDTPYLEAYLPALYAFSLSSIGLFFSSGIRV